MAETEILDVQLREKAGTSHARRLRKQGNLPAVLYGHKEKTESLTVSEEDFSRALRHGARLVELRTGSRAETALIREVQWDTYGQEILHVDFARVSRDEKIEIDVSVVTKGTSPGVEAGGILEQPLHELSIECPAMSVPENIVVNINEIQLGQVVHVKDLTLPPGVVALNEPEEVVLHVVEPQAEPEDEEEAGEQAEPEIIKQKKEDEESEGN